MAAACAAVFLLLIGESGSPISRRNGLELHSYIFTLDIRRSDAGSAYRPWAVAVIEPDIGVVAVRVKKTDETMRALRFDHGITNLPQVQQIRAECEALEHQRPHQPITRQVPALFSLFNGLAAQLQVEGSEAVYREQHVVRDAVRPADYALDQLADEKFAQWRTAMIEREWTCRRAELR